MPLEKRSDDGKSSEGGALQETKNAKGHSVEKFYSISKHKANKGREGGGLLSPRGFDKALPFTPLTPFFNAEPTNAETLLGDGGWAEKPDEESESSGLVCDETGSVIEEPGVSQMVAQPGAGRLANSASMEFAGQAEARPSLKASISSMFSDASTSDKAKTSESAQRSRQKDKPAEKNEGKKKGFFEGLRKIARGMHDLTATKRPERAQANYSSMNISLDPREQSLLYCELEYHLTSAVHGYITTQFNHGRLDANKLKRVADAWVTKGRPRVVGFRYDLETQLELVAMHDAEFRFYGRRQKNLLEIGALLYAMRINARAMQVRTLCQPDSVVAKQLVDSQSLFNMMGVPHMQQAALLQIGHFFRAIVERESLKRKEAERTGMQTPMVGPGPASEFPMGGEIRSDMPSIYSAPGKQADVGSQQGQQR